MMIRALLKHESFRCLTLLALGLATCSANSAEFEAYCTTDSRGSEVCAITLSGSIEPGDAVALDDMVGKTARSKEGRTVRWLILNSRGGNVAEAIRVAAVVRERLLWTSNLNILRFDYTSQSQAERDGHVCASSCVLILLSGGNRILISNPIANARIGLHRPYIAQASAQGLSPGELAGIQQQAERQLRAFLESERVPSDLIEEMMRRSSKDIYWITRKDLLGLDSGYASWFQELKIARCDWSPTLEQKLMDVYDRKTGQDKEVARDILSDYLGRAQYCIESEARRTQLNAGRSKVQRR